MVQHNTEATLKAIRELMQRPEKSFNSNEEIFELSEDDLIDEQDKDAFLHQRLPEKANQINEINELLTQIKHSNNIQIQHDINKEVSAESAARSIEIIKAILKKAESDPGASKRLKNQSSLDELVTEALKPILLEWSEDKLKEIIQPIVEKEVRKYFHKNEGLE